MGIFGKFKQDNSIKAEVIESYGAFSSPFTKIPKGNLSTPYINGRYQTQGYIPFGSDNLYPQYLNQLYYTSPLHGAIVDFKTNAAVGGGFEYEHKLSAAEKVLLLQIASQIGFNKLMPNLTKDLQIHERIYFKIYMEHGRVKEYKYLSPSKVRANKDRTEYSISEDWVNTTQHYKLKPYDRKCKEGTYIVPFEWLGVGQDIYPVPSYTSASNFMYLSGELSFLQKANIQNSVYPSFAMLFPKRPQSDEEMQTIKDSVANMKGAENAGKPVAFFANSKDTLPELVNVPTNGNDNLFKETSDLITEQICFSHTIDPILLGVRTTGSLGSGSDIKQAYTIFEKNVVKPLRERIEYIFNSLLDIAQLDCKIVINNYQIINDTIAEVQDNPIINALSSLPDDLRAKVMENMTADEIRALAGLKSNTEGI